VADSGCGLADLEQPRLVAVAAAVGRREAVAGLAEKEGSDDDAVTTWREALVELGVVEVRLTSDVRGVTIDFDGTAPQAVNDDNAKPLASAIGRGVDRLRTKKKSEDGDRARRSARDSPDESE
jgi:hypothetical protein